MFSPETVSDQGTAASGIARAAIKYGWAFSTSYAAKTTAGAGIAPSAHRSFRWLLGQYEPTEVPSTKQAAPLGKAETGFYIKYPLFGSTQARKEGLRPAKQSGDHLKAAVLPRMLFMRNRAYRSNP